MGKSLQILVITTALLWGIGHAFAETAPEGYTSNVRAEKAQRFHEIYIFRSPAPQEKTLQELIFNPLAAEFKNRYREKFGQIDTESLVYKQNNFDLLDGHPNVQATQDENDKRKAFAEYMTRRLLEFHVDNYLKTQPQMAPVMKVKEQIQNVKVEVNKDTRLNLQYDFAGNIIDAVLENPYCDSKLSLEMNPSAFGPSDVNEYRIWLGKNLTTTVRVNSRISVTDGIAYADISKAYPKFHIGTVFGYSQDFKPGGTSIRQSLYVIGISHDY